MGAQADVVRRWYLAPEVLALLWTGILAGPLAWTLDFLIGYSLTPGACSGGVWQLFAMRVLPLGALALIGAGALASWRGLRAVADGAIVQRGVFMARLGLLLSGVFTIVVIASTILRWTINACR